MSLSFLFQDRDLLLSITDVTLFRVRCVSVKGFRRRERDGTGGALRGPGVLLPYPD